MIITLRNITVLPHISVITMYKHNLLFFQSRFIVQIKNVYKIVRTNDYEFKFTIVLAYTVDRHKYHLHSWRVQQ